MVEESEQREPSTNTRRTPNEAGGEMSLTNDSPGTPKSLWDKHLQQQSTTNSPLPVPEGHREAEQVGEQEWPIPSPATANQLSSRG